MQQQSVFIQKNNKPEPGLNLGVVLNRTPVKGDIGLEIEIEGSRLPHEGETPPPWSYVKDGSLRGKDNGEYVLSKPLPFDKVDKALDALWDKFKEMKSVLDDSNRTSVHVHLNCQEFHLNRLTSFAAIYFCMEEILTAYCGEHRKGNLFCLTARDAPAIITHLKKFIQQDGTYQLNFNILHYAGFAACSLAKYGSIEIRTMRGLTEPGDIRNWVNILRRIYDVSAEYEDPRELMALFSGVGPLSFFDVIMGDMGNTLRAGIKMSNDEISESMYAGIRLAQDLCYCRDWDLYKSLTLNPDPFGRSVKSMAKRLTGYDVAVATGDEVTLPSGSLAETVQLYQAAMSGMQGAVVEESQPEPDYDDQEHYEETNPFEEIQW